MPYLIADGRRSIQYGVARDTFPNFTYNPSNFTIELNKPINKVIGIELLHAEIPPTPVVITGWNDYITWYETNTGTRVSATLTQGYYTPDEFITMVNSVMTAAGGTYTSTYDANTNKYTIIGTSSRFLLGSEAFALFSAGTITREQYNAYFKASYLLGVAIGPSGSTTFSTSYELAYETDLRGIRYFTIEVELNGFGNQDVITSKDSVSFVVPKNTKELIGYSTVDREKNYGIINEISNINVNHVHVRTFYEDDNQEDEIFQQDIFCLFKIHTKKTSNII